MNTEDLKRTLEQLHRELEGGAAVDPELRTILKTLDADIHKALRQPQGVGAAAPETELSARAREVSARFAADHPYLESALRDLMDALAKMGI